MQTSPPGEQGEGCPIGSGRACDTVFELGAKPSPKQRRFSGRIEAEQSREVFPDPFHSRIIWDIVADSERRFGLSVCIHVNPFMDAHDSMGRILAPEAFHADGIHADIAFMVSEEPALCGKVAAEINNREMLGDDL